MQINNINHLPQWQYILLQAQAQAQAQALAARLPEIGLNPDKLELLPLNDLVGVLAFLKRKSAERKG